MRWKFGNTKHWLSALVLLPLTIMLIVMGGSTIPANRVATPPTQGVTIHIYTNGVHTGLVLPTVNALHDWRRRVPASDLPDPRRAGQWLLFGWGQRDFYLNTPTWDQVDPATVVRAMVGSDRTLMHVDHLRRVWRGPDLRAVVVTPEQYRKLVAAIDADFAPGAAIAGYGPDDVFYPGRGRYSSVRTCNEWTGEKLRAIGVRVGIWTPLSWSVMRWF